MCHARDLWIFEERARKQAEEMKAKEERRAGVIDTLLNDANKLNDQTKPEEAPVKEAAPAK